MPFVFVLLWSTGFIVAKMAAPHAPPLTFLLLRFAGVVIVLLPLAWVTHAPWHRRRAVVDAAIVDCCCRLRIWAACGSRLRSDAGRSVLAVGGTQPLLCTLGATVGERVGRVQWLGLLLGIVGIALVLSDRLTLAGVGVVALSVNALALLGITAGTLYRASWHRNRLAHRKHHPVRCVLCRTAAVRIGVETMRVDATIEFWLALAWSVFALSLAAISLLLVMIRRGRATEVASLMYLTPAVTAMLAWIVFGERLGVLAWCGVAVTMAGVALVVRRWGKGT
jgi:drug/metabolite transporter (DMT)-like permease